MVVVIVAVCLFLMFCSYIIGYSSGCMTGRAETMEVYKDPNEQM